MKVRSAAVGRLLALAAIAIASVAPAAFSSAADATAVDRSAAVGSGFAGPVTERPHALDVDRSSSAATLRPVRCATTLPGTRCWVSLSLR